MVMAKTLKQLVKSALSKLQPRSKKEFNAEEIDAIKGEIDKETINNVKENKPIALQAHKKGVKLSTETPSGETKSIDPLEYWVRKDTKNLYYLLENKIKINGKNPILFFLEEKITVPGTATLSDGYDDLGNPKFKEVELENRSIFVTMMNDPSFKIGGMNGTEYKNSIEKKYPGEFEEYQKIIVAQNEARDTVEKQAPIPQENQSEEQSVDAPAQATQTELTPDKLEEMRQNIEQKEPDVALQAALDAHNQGATFDKTQIDGTVVKLDPLEYYIQQDAGNLRHILNPNNDVQIDGKDPIAFFLDRNTTLPPVEIANKEYTSKGVQENVKVEEQSIIAAIAGDEKFSVSIDGKEMNGTQYMQYARENHKGLYDKYQDNIIKQRNERASQAEAEVGVETPETVTESPAAPETSETKNTDQEIDDFIVDNIESQKVQEIQQEKRASAKMQPETLSDEIETEGPAQVQANLQPEELESPEGQEKTVEELLDDIQKDVDSMVDEQKERDSASSQQEIDEPFVFDKFDQMEKDLKQGNSQNKDEFVDAQKSQESSAQKEEGQKELDKILQDGFEKIRADSSKNIEKAKTEPEKDDIALDPKLQADLEKTVAKSRETLNAGKADITKPAHERDNPKAEAPDQKGKQEEGEKVDKDSKDPKQDYKDRKESYNKSIGELKGDLKHYRDNQKDNTKGAIKSGLATVALVMVAVVFPPAAPIALAGAAIAGIMTAVKSVKAAHSSTKADKADRDIKRQTYSDTSKDAKEQQNDVSKEKTEPTKALDAKEKWVSAEKPTAEKSDIQIGSAGKEAAEQIAKTTGEVKSTDTSSKKSDNTPGKEQEQQEMER